MEVKSSSTSTQVEALQQENLKMSEKIKEVERNKKAETVVLKKRTEDKLNKELAEQDAY